VEVHDAPRAADAAQDERAARENCAANVKGDDGEIAEDIRAHVGELRDRRRRSALLPLREGALEDLAAAFPSTRAGWLADSGKKNVASSAKLATIASASMWARPLTTASTTARTSRSPFRGGADAQAVSNMIITPTT